MDAFNRIIKSVSQMGNNSQTSSSKQNIALVVDVSGSTYIPFISGMTVLEKEQSTLSEYVLANDNNYCLYTFDSNSTYHGELQVLREEGFVTLPPMIPGSSTLTCKPLQQINDNFAKFKANKVILFTDGQTNSRGGDLIRIIQSFKDKKIAFEIIAVTGADINLQQLSQQEENRIPGMDLINFVGNMVDNFKIYTPTHKDQPFKGMVSSAVEKNALTFMGVPISGVIPTFIDNLLTALHAEKDTLDWGANQTHLKQLICEIGKLMSVIFVQYDPQHIFTYNVTDRIRMLVDITAERVDNILLYGFNCAKQKKPTILINLDGRLKEVADKRGEFASAVDQLNSVGTTLGAYQRICLPLNGLCCLDDSTLLVNCPLGNYTNSRDAMGNTWFGCDASPQAIRIAIRELCNVLGIPNARNSPNIIFFVTNLMSLIAIKQVPLDCIQMIELRKLAICQTSMEVMVAQNKYDGMGCYLRWKKGELPPMNFRDPATHTSLYTDPRINPLKLSEPLWWALMMSMLGIFTEQLPTYENAVIAFLNGAEVTCENFLKQITTTYSANVVGNPVMLRLEPPKESIITLDKFSAGEAVFCLKDHGDGAQRCKTNTWYSAEEIETYVKIHGCVWCKYIPVDADFESVTFENNAKKLENTAKKAKRLQVVGINASAEPIIQGMERLDLDDEKESSVQNPIGKYIIFMQGITGAGKSTTSEMLTDILKGKGYQVLVVSADKLSKQGMKGQALSQAVFRDIQKFDQLKTKRVIIVDICNENGIKPQCFGYDVSQYRPITIVPNFNPTDNFNDYECWCLRNVLNRKMHNAATNYWLNPEAAGINTCLKVHNMKADGIRNSLKIKTPQMKFNEAMNLADAKAMIEEGASRHAAILATRNLKQTLEGIVQTKGL
jgi:hypothetical protein